MRAQPRRSRFHAAAIFVGLAAAALLSAGPARAVALCDSTSKGWLPLTELGLGTYKGELGGLYPGGTNAMPDSHLAAGLALAGSISPLDTLGVPNAANGRIVLLSIGMSNCTQEYSTFIPLAISSGLKNPRVQLVDGAQGGQTAAVFADPNAPAWDVVTQRLRNAGARAPQVQAIWLKEANAGPTQAFPLHAQILRDDLRAVVRNLQDKFPNAKLCYMSSRTYGGYASTALNPEPYAYESGFAVRWLIEEQLEGGAAVNFDPARGPVEAPWLAWGPYLWADGLTPRAADGLIWECADVVTTDGTHPSTSGRAKIADLLLDFFTSDVTATPWFLASSVGVGAGAGASGDGRAATLRLSPARPNPSNAGFTLDYEGASGAPLVILVRSVDGRLVRRWGAGASGGRSGTIAWDGRDARGRLAPAGLYVVELVAVGARARTKLLVVPR
jgi:hypothetical protein